MSVLDSKFDILRGWPGGGAVAIEVKKAATANTAKQTAGTWIKLDPLADAHNGAPTVHDAAAVSTNGAFCGLVLEGLEDNSSSMSGTITVLVGGGYIVRLENKAADAEMYTNANLEPGAAVRVDAGIIKASAAAGDTIGYVLQRSAAIGTATGTVDILVVGPSGNHT